MNIYHIKVKGIPGSHITEWFSDLTVTPLEHGEALLTVPVADQAALRGLLDTLWDFNITVIEVERIEK